MRKIFVVILLLAISIAAYSQKNNRMLIVSGGGARGAWGVGVVEGLMYKQGLNDKDSAGYVAVFGTSTGSLMAPFILLKDTTRLADLYCSVTQKSIFNVNPFKVNVDSSGVVTAEPNWIKAAIRLLFGCRTLGESEPLRKLIHDNFGDSEFHKLMADSLYLAVAVTNMRTGDIEIRNSKDVNDGRKMGDWIWASGNEPLWMSYYDEKDSEGKITDSYVDGGLRDIVPVRAGLEYAFEKKIRNVDIVINNMRTPIERKWRANKSWATGLLRTLDIYSAGVVAKDTLLAYIYSEALNCKIDTGTIKNPDTIAVHLYFMPDTLAKKYPYELAFFKAPMQNLLLQGRNMILNAPAATPPGSHITITAKQYNLGVGPSRRH